MTRRFIFFILLSCAAFISVPILAQNGPNGRYYTPPPNQVNPVYVVSCNPGNQSASPATCSLSIPAGGSFIGIAAFNGVAATLSGSCGGIGDGTGTGGCTGSDSVTINPVYKNGSTFEDYTFSFCGVAAAVTTITVTWTGSSSFMYMAGAVFYGVNGSCIDGAYAQHQSTSATTAYTTVGGSPATVTPTTPNDVMVGLTSNHCGGTITAGNDTQGNSYSLAVSNNGVVGIETFPETSIAAYGATFTGPSCSYNIYAFAIKGYATQNGNPINWGSNGRNYQNTASSNGKFYGEAYAATGLIDFGKGGTNTNVPTQTTLFNSINGSVCTPSSCISISGMGTNTKYTNAQQPVVLAAPAVISSAGYGGGGGLGIGGATTSGGTGVGDVIYNQGTNASTSLGFTVYSSCPYTIGTDCGAQGGLYGTSSYITSHFRQFGSYPYMSAVMENHDGGTIVYNPLPNASSYIYRVNMQLNTSGNDYMILCDTNNRLLYSWTMTAAANGALNLEFGITGEEPTTAGYNYYWWNADWNSSGAGFNINGPCF
jgi:hypothetical protein